MYNDIFSQSQSNLQPKWHESASKVEPGPSTSITSHTRSKVEVFNYEIDTDTGKDAEYYVVNVLVKFNQFF